MVDLDEASGRGDDSPKKQTCRKDPPGADELDQVELRHLHGTVSKEEDSRCEAERLCGQVEVVLHLHLHGDGQGDGFLQVEILQVEILQVEVSCTSTCMHGDACIAMAFTLSSPFWPSPG